MKKTVTIADHLFTWINKNFLIRVSSSTDLTKKNARLYSARRLRELLGVKLFFKHLKALQNLQADKLTVKLRRGLTIDFISR